MARIVAGVGTSHVPAIGAASDHGKDRNEYFKPLFDGYDPAREWLANINPDLVFLIYNDHASAFSVELINTFVLGVANEYHPADEGYGPRPVPVMHSHADFASHINECLIFDEFDIAIANEMVVDHGGTVPLTIMYDRPDEWPCKVIPLCVNVIKYPQPSGLRCFKLGKALRKAIESYPEDLRVAVFGTGGMSHQLQGERAGFINQDFDKMFLDNLQDNPEKLTEIGHTEYLRDSGSEGIEMIMWLMMRGAMKKPREVYRHYHVPVSNTAAGLVCYEEDAA